MVSCPTHTQNLELYLIKGARNFNVISVITMLQPHKIWPNTRSQVCPCAFIQILLKLYRNFIHFFWKNSLDPDFLTKFTWSKILHKLTFIPKLEQDLIQIFIWIKWGQSRNKIWINEHGHEFTYSSWEIKELQMCPMRSSLQSKNPPQNSYSKCSRESETFCLPFMWERICRQI